MEALAVIEKNVWFFAVFNLKLMINVKDPSVHFCCSMCNAQLIKMNDPMKKH